MSDFPQRRFEPLGMNQPAPLPESEEATVIAATREILGELLETMKRTRAGILEDADIEYLHDFRVAVRRVRTLLGEIKRFLPADPVDDLRSEIKWLASETGPQRDLDVQLEQIGGLRDDLSDESSKALEPVVAHLAKSRSGAHAALVSAIGSARYHRLVSCIESFAYVAGPESEAGQESARPITAVLRKRIRKRRRQVRKDGRRLDAHSGPEALHKLRKDCKKLRYLVEFYYKFYEPDDANDVLRPLRRLQNALGAYQDCAVQIRTLRRCERELRETDHISEDTARAIGCLLDEIAETQAAARAQFEDRFAAFDKNAKNRRSFLGEDAPS